MIRLISFALSAFIIGLTLLTSSSSAKYLSVSATSDSSNTVKEKKAVYQQAIVWLYKYTNRWCTQEASEEIRELANEIGKQVSVFRNSLKELKNITFSAIENGIENTDICFGNSQHLQKILQILIDFEQIFQQLCNPGNVKTVNQEVQEAIKEIIVEEICTRTIYQAIYYSDKECQDNIQLAKTQCDESELKLKPLSVVPLRILRRYSNVMNGFIQLVSEDFFPFFTCSFMSEKRNCHLNAVKDCKPSTKDAAEKLWSLPEEDPLCTTNREKEIAELLNVQPILNY